MGAFSQHCYSFTDQNRKNWFRLLRKYYYKVSIDISIDKVTYNGKISKRFFENLPLGKRYTVNLNCGAEVAAIQAMPVFVRPEVKESNRELQRIAL